MKTSRAASRFLPLIVLLAVLGFGCEQRSSTTSPPALDHAVYVWQGNWTEPVYAAIEHLPASVSGVVPLAAEITFDNGAHKVRCPKFDPVALVGVRPRDAVAIRIGASGASTGWNQKACAAVAEVCVAVLDQATSAGWRPCELQIDYDCPQSKLEDYLRLLQSVKHMLAQRTDPPHLTFTALPSWLGAREFARLARVTGSYVLQVHALVAPEGSSGPVSIFDPVAARGAITKADAIGVPFRVALPTYSSYCLFDRTGTLVDVFSEDLPDQLPPGMLARLGNSNPQEIASLVSELSSAPPVSLRGFLWYRLPVSGDVMNWSTLTWRIVMDGRAPQSQVELRAKRSEQGYMVVSIHNTGECAVPLPAVIRAHASERPLASDGSNHYQVRSPNALTMEFFLPETSSDRLPLPPGRERVIGWVRWPDSVTTTDIQLDNTPPR